MDASVRLAAFRFLEEQTQLPGEVLPRENLARGFQVDGSRVPLIGPQGIFKPTILDLPLSITTVPLVEGRPRPYEDRRGRTPAVSLPRHRPQPRDNVGLRLALERRVPLIYFHGIVTGRYMAS